MAATDGKITVEKNPERKTIKERFSDFHGEHAPVEIDWGVPVGDEVF